MLLLICKGSINTAFKFISSLKNENKAKSAKWLQFDSTHMLL